MNIDNTYASYELAKKLKELGFNYPTSSFYDEFSPEHPLGKNMSFNNHNAFNDEVSCPTLDLAHRWLREEYNIFIPIWNNASGYSYFINKSSNGTTIDNLPYKGTNDGGMWNTYEEALEEGIRDSLKILIKQ